MTNYKGGQTARKGFYLERSTGEIVQLYGDTLVLPGDSQVRYLKTPALVAMVLGSLAGLAFIIFLPMTGIVAIVGFLVSKLVRWMQPLVHSAWRTVTLSRSHQ